MTAESIEELFDKGVALFSSGRLLEAIACFDEVINRNPAHVNGWTNKGATLARLERDADALERFDIALTMDSNNLHTLLDKGIILGRQDKNQDAQENISKAAAFLVGREWQGNPTGDSSFCGVTNHGSGLYPL